MKYARFTRVTDNKVFEVYLDDELWDLFRETGEYVDKMQAVVNAAKDVLQSDGYHYLCELREALEELDSEMG